MSMSDRLAIRRLSTPALLRDELAADVRAGLLSPPRTLPPKYFYDARGSQLFEEITRLPEYYPTRAETEILEAEAEAIVDAVMPTEILELGSGSSRKTRVLLEAMHGASAGERYVALDVSEDAIRVAADALTADYPWLEVVGLVGDFHSDLEQIPHGGPRLVAFLGSTIGNLDPSERSSFFPAVAGLLDADDVLLLGVDLVKDAGTLEAAYDDDAGITAEFNKNVLAVINRELDGDLPLDAFGHVAVFDKEASWVEMRLRARREVRARLAAIDADLVLAAGEEIRTEISAKFTREGIEAELSAAGLRMASWWTDTRDRFALLLARPHPRS